MSTNMSHQYNTPGFLSTTRLQYDVGFGGGRNSGIVVYKSGLLECSQKTNKQKKVHESGRGSRDPAASSRGPSRLWFIWAAPR